MTGERKTEKRASRMCSVMIGKHTEFKRSLNFSGYRSGTGFVSFSFAHSVNDVETCNSRSQRYQ